MKNLIKHTCQVYLIVCTHLKLITRLNQSMYYVSVVPHWMPTSKDGCVTGLCRVNKAGTYPLRRAFKESFCLWQIISKECKNKLLRDAALQDTCITVFEHFPNTEINKKKNVLRNQFIKKNKVIENTKIPSSIVSSSNFLYR